MKTNIEQVTAFMEFGSPLHQAFVMEAICRYATICVENADHIRESMKDTLIHPEAWLACAKDWQKQYALDHPTQAQ